jgi:hypothetical protein
MSLDEYRIEYQQLRVAYNFSKPSEGILSKIFFVCEVALQYIDE